MYSYTHTYSYLHAYVYIYIYLYVYCAYICNGMRDRLLWSFCRDSRVTRTACTGSCATPGASTGARWATSGGTRREVTHFWRSCASKALENIGNSPVLMGIRMV